MQEFPSYIYSTTQLWSELMSQRGSWSTSPYKIGSEPQQIELWIEIPKRVMLLLGMPRNSLDGLE